MWQEKKHLPAPALLLSKLRLFSMPCPGPHGVRDPWNKYNCPCYHLVSWASPQVLLSLVLVAPLEDVQRLRELTAGTSRGFIDWSVLLRHTFYRPACFDELASSSGWARRGRHEGVLMRPCHLRLAWWLIIVLRSVSGLIEPFIPSMGGLILTMQRLMAWRRKARILRLKAGDACGCDHSPPVPRQLLCLADDLGLSLCLRCGSWLTAFSS